MPREFCINKGFSHPLEKLVVEYYKKKHGTKKIKCNECGRVLMKNGIRVNQGHNLAMELEGIK